ncbi:helix-turn-helix domain-containing protein [Nesterenkonia suensis]
MNTFDQYLRAAMDERGWTQADLARATGLRDKDISVYLNKGVTPSSGNLRKIADGLRRPLSEVRQAAGKAPAVGEFHLSEERQADAETLTPPQRQAVEDIIRLLAEGNRKAVGDDEPRSASKTQADHGSAQDDEHEDEHEVEVREKWMYGRAAHEKRRDDAHRDWEEQAL